MVENKPPKPVKEPVSGVKSCQTNKKEENIFHKLHHSDYVSVDILPRFTWDRWLFALRGLAVMVFEEVSIVQLQEY